MKIIEGDLLKIEHGYILHQVNCMGATGGLAGALRRRWPMAFVCYDNACLEGSGDPRQLLGEAVFGGNTPRIVHVFGQLKPGPNTEYRFVDKAIESLICLIRGSRSPIYVPYGMDCGLGGGDWSIYSKIIEKHLPDAVIVRKVTR